jgi:hypothetical protein
VLVDRHPGGLLPGLVHRLEYALLKEGLDDPELVRADDRLHAGEHRPEVGPQGIEPGRGRLEDVRRLRVDNFVAGVGQPLGRAVDAGAHLRIDSSARRVSHHGHADLALRTRPLQRRRHPARITRFRGGDEAEREPQVGDATCKRPLAIGHLDRERLGRRLRHGAMRDPPARRPQRRDPAHLRWHAQRATEVVADA